MSTPGFIRLLTCAHGHQALALASDAAADAGTRIAGGCCGSWTATKTWSVDLATIRDDIDAIINAPRDAARAAAEVVAEDDGVRLLKTSMGEWGTEEIEDAKRYWFEAEEFGRASFAHLRGKALCDNCPAEVDKDEITEAGEDGPEVCPACATALQEAFATARYRCVGERTADQPGCGWTGTGAEVTVEDGQTFCPICVDASEAEEVDDAAVPA